MKSIMMSSPSSIEPPRKSPKFPPNCPRIQVKSHAKYSSLCVMMKSEKAICKDTPVPCIVQSSNLTSYFVEKQGGGHADLVLERRSEGVNISLS